MKDFRGRFIAIEGVSGSGKSTVIDCLKLSLSLSLPKFIFTKEPTPLFQLSNENNYSGDKLFKLLLKDRATHIQEFIEPAINKGLNVITDRYILSSLVFQRLDGLDINYIWNCNKNFIQPDLIIVLTVDEQIAVERVIQRGRMSRLKQLEIRKREQQFTVDAVDFLQEHGFIIQCIDNSHSSPENTTKSILQIL